MTDCEPSKASESIQQSLANRETVAPSGLEDSTPTGSGPFAALPSQFGRYRVTKLLGRGAMGTVYLAHDPDLGKEVALKVPKFSGDEDPVLLERFRREARAAGDLNHANICGVYEVGQIGTTHFIAMEYIDGRPLSDYISPDLPCRKIAILVRRLALALAQAHDRGIVHRDLKPANIMVNLQGEPVIMDFGLARRLDAAADVRATQSGMIVGSPAYMSPEQAGGENDKIGPWTDIYGLGVLYFELLTGSLPFRGSMLSVLGQLATQPPPKPSSLRADVDPRLELLCLKMLEKKPQNRPASMTEVAQSLTEWLKPAAAKSEPAISLVEEPVALSPTKPAALRADKVDGLEAHKQRVIDLLDKRQYGPALELLEKITNLRDAKFEKLVAWAKPKLKEVRATEQKLREASAPSCDTARQLLKHYDYVGVIQVLEQVPPAYRSIELRDLLEEVTDLRDECDHLQRDIEEAVRTRDIETLPALVKRLYKLRPNNKAIKQLSADLKEYGAAKVIARRKGQRRFLDPAGRIVEPSQIILAVLVIAVIFGAVTVTVRNYLATGKPSGRVKLSDQVTPTPTPPTPTPPKPTPLSQTITSQSTGMTLTLVPDGTFTMGSPASEAGRSPDEGPQHEVKISQSFYMGIHEVTQSQYESVMGNNPSKFSKSAIHSGRVIGMDTSQFPVESVSWFDAISYCNRLSQKDGLPEYYTLTVERRVNDTLESATVTIKGGNGYRLPTEAEWEYACRARSSTPFHFGITCDGREANVDGTIPYGVTIAGPALKRTEKVGSYLENAFGLFDMHGNVGEWCFDIFDDAAYKGRIGTTTDPVVTANKADRVRRGGSHLYDAAIARSAFRNRGSPIFVGDHLGFRVVRNASGTNSGNKGALPIPVPPSFAGVTPGQGKELVPGMNFHWCPEGSFMMGSPASEQGRGKNEGGVSVILSSGFWLSETEVTQGQWQALMKTAPWTGKSFVKDGSDYPAGHISRGEADDGKLNVDSASGFCQRLTLQERAAGRLSASWKYVLPTEAQWEYACRAKTTTKYSFGDDEGRLGEHAWFAQNTNFNDRHAQHVGLKKPNPWGLRDMHGNVWEWCADRYGDKLSGGPDPRGAASGSMGVYRGGCIFDDASLCRAAYRNNGPSVTQMAAIGFRVAAVPSGVADVKAAGPPPPITKPVGITLQSLPAVSLKAGEKRSFKVAVTRENADGEIRLQLQGLPSLVTCNAKPIPRGASEVDLELVAGTGDTDATASVQLIATMGAVTTTRAFSLTVAKRPDVELIFEDDFKDPNKRRLAVFDNDNVRKGYENGLYVLAMRRGSERFVGVTVPESVRDFEFETKVRFIGMAEPNHVSIGFRDDAQPKKMRTLFWDIYFKNTRLIRQIIDLEKPEAGWKDEIQWEGSHAGFINPGPPAAWNVLKIRAHGGTVELTTNDKLMSRVVVGGPNYKPETRQIVVNLVSERVGSCSLEFDYIRLKRINK